ncbi:Tpr-related protein family member, putative [Theileria annulata]|uniref:Tpr-related protein family member, putative n=1 Tax=Theileria annulata TaxID=5874 RepID=Q4UF57_THEAN|nr:Tpr-related protein family member, putative [Theileria annulata]CAI74282.1 Tpr-related protein family member, putative [Theileria annulata]|eukprot:XP_952014.1 Tpr-related protein family member, putative [Theileria annulata]
MEPNQCPHCTNGQAAPGSEDCPLLMSAYILAGLAMMLNIRLSYSSAPYALIRFKLPENLFSVFVRRMASALELWCLPSMLLGNFMEYGLKGYYQTQNYTSDFGIGGGNLKDKEFGITTGYKVSGGESKKVEIIFTNIPNIDTLVPARLLKFTWIIFPSIVAQWLNFLTYVILFFVYVIGGDQGHLTLFYFVIAISGFVFGINMVLVYAADWNYTPVYIVGENTFPIVTSFMHYISTLIFGNRRKWNSDFILVLIDIWVAIIISFVAAAVWTAAYGYYLDTQKENVITFHRGNTKAAGPTDLSDITIDSITITDTKGKPTATYNQGGPAPPDAPTLIITKDGQTTATTPATFTKQEATPPAGTPNSIILKYTRPGTKGSAITITGKPDIVPFGHIFTEKFDTSTVRWQIISPTLMVIVGMGLVYAIYPGIAPGMIVPFYLIDKIEMVLLIATFFPPVIVALLNRGTFGESTKAYSPKNEYQAHKFGEYEQGFGGWRSYIKHKPNQNYTDCDTSEPKTPDIHNWFWHFFDILIVIKISLAAIFIYSLHYRDSDISRSIINQPKMSTALSIVFYMCHEILLALGFAGVIGNNGGTYVVLPAQYIGALFMIFLAFYSEGYIIEYKSHDPAHLPTD